MTAETLKPFITPQSVDNFPATHSSTSTRHQRSCNIIAIVIGVVSLILASILLVFLIVNTNRLSKLETEVSSLNKVVEHMHKRLGLNYLDEISMFEKEYTNALIDDTDGEEEIENEDIDDDELIREHDKDKLTSDEYDDIENYDDLIKKFNSYDDSDDDDDENISDDDNLYDDFEKYKDSKKKIQSARKTRSIDNVNVITTDENSEKVPQNKSTTANETETKNISNNHRTSYKTKLRIPEDALDTLSFKSNNQRQFVSENIDGKRSPLRSRLHRRRKIPVYRSGESLSLTAKSATMLNSNSLMTPAAHFHLTHKIPDRHAAYKVDSYAGDMYIGQPSTSSNYFKVEQGVLKVIEPGLYYIYAQVCYNNTHDQNGFVIFHGHKPFLQCLNTVPTNMPLKIHTCHTSGLINLRADETIHLRDFHSDRNVILKDSNNRSYFGLIKI